ncbi:MAG: UbiD family decarboxylase, partial [Rikenellaceae bacterium]
MYKNLREFINTLEREGELIRIKDEVSTDLQIARITDEQCKKEGGGKALLFENTQTPFAVATNLMGSDRRISLALGTENLGSLGERIMTLFAKVTKPKNSFLDKLRFLPAINDVSKWMPRRVKGFGECQQMIMSGDDVDLSIIPILKCAPHDGGPFITLPLVNTIDPKTGINNLGMYRMQIIDDKTTAMHWHIHKTGERHYAAYKALNQLMPVSVCLGGDPSYTYSATAPLPEGIDEYMLAGFIRRRGVKLVKCITNDIYVPSDCDFVIEGYVDPSEEKFYEGPFGDHTGFYSLEDYYPKFHVTCITHRGDAIYPATIVGVPPMEDAYIAKATESIFLAP